jgi:DNA processing protein
VDDASLYPRAHRALAAAIVAGGGAVMSEYPPGTGARAEYFPQRNRVIAGLSHAVVVVEAAATSGALITARSALAENREVLAVPGPVTSKLSEGTNRLLKEGAAPACGADDILEALALSDVLQLPRAPQATGETSSSADAELPARRPPPDTVLRTLTQTPMDLDALIAATTRSPHEISAALSLLELDGRVRDVGAKNYVRCQAVDR